MDPIDNTQRIRHRELESQRQSIEEALEEGTQDEQYDLNERQRTELSLLTDTLGITDHQY